MYFYIIYICYKELFMDSNGFLYSKQECLKVLLNLYNDREKIQLAWKKIIKGEITVNNNFLDKTYAPNLYSSILNENIQIWNQTNENIQAIQSFGKLKDKTDLESVGDYTLKKRSKLFMDSAKRIWQKKTESSNSYIIVTEILTVIDHSFCDNVKPNQLEFNENSTIFDYNYQRNSKISWLEFLQKNYLDDCFFVGLDESQCKLEKRINEPSKLCISWKINLNEHDLTAIEVDFLSRDEKERYNETWMIFRRNCKSLGVQYENFENPFCFRRNNQFVFPLISFYHMYVMFAEYLDVENVKKPCNFIRIAKSILPEKFK